MEGKKKGIVTEKKQRLLSGQHSEMCTHVGHVMGERLDVSRTNDLIRELLELSVKKNKKNSKL